jgi:hypothetical protein
MGAFSFVYSSHIPHLESRRQAAFFIRLRAGDLPVNLAQW